jgi:hypothetical protein
VKTPYIRFDEREDAVAALELVARIAPDLKENPSLWKWMVIGMQNAMQAAMVLALAGSDGCGALREKSQKRNREWLAKPSGPQPPVVMADYGTLLQRVQCKELMEGTPLQISANNLLHLDRLNKLRRDFAHFNPKRWSIELALLLLVMPIALDTVQDLLKTQRRVQLHLTSKQKDSIYASFLGIRTALMQLDEGPASK